MKRVLEDIFIIDGRALALLRIALGLLIVCDALFRLTDLDAYTDNGVYPIAAALAERGSTRAYWSFHFINGSVEWNGALLVFLAVCGTGLLLGWRTRIMTLLCWGLVLSTQNRLPNNSGADSELGVLLFWSLFLDLGMRWSLDACIRSKKRSRPLFTATCSVASAALLLQVCFIYWFSAIAKQSPEWRTDYTAVSVVLEREDFQRPLGAWLVKHRELSKLLTQLTLLLEEAGPFFALAPVRFWRTRTFAALAFMTFHALGLGLTMRLGFFPAVAAAAWLPFLPRTLFDRVERLFNSLFHMAGKSRMDALPLDRYAVQGDESWLQKSVVLLAMGLAFWLNLASVFISPFGTGMPAHLRIFSYCIGLRQNWKFFSPRPGTRSGWFVAEAVLQDGRTVDPIHGGAVSFERPNLAHHYSNHRWFKYFDHLYNHRKVVRIEAYCNFLVRSCNQQNPGNPVVSLALYYVLADSSYPEDGMRKVRVFPFRAIDHTGRGARYEGDIRQDRVDKIIDEADRS